MTVRTYAASVCVVALLSGGAMTGCRSGNEQPQGAGTKTGENGKPAAPANAPYYYGLIEEYRTVVAQDPRNLAAVVALGNAYYDTGQWKEAIRQYEQALRINPHNADVITDMGTCYRNMGNTDQALALYERALKVEPTHANALYNLGVVHGHDRRAYGKAIAYWEQLLRVAPNHPRAEAIRVSIAKFRKLQKGGAQ